MPDDLLESFARYARAVAAQIVVADDLDAAVAAIADATTGALRCMAAVAEQYPALCRALTDAGHPVTVAAEPPAPVTDRAGLATSLAGDTGLVLARAGVAETGSVVLADDGLAARLLGMLADVCVALLPGAAILPDLDAAAALLADLDRAGHRYVSLVTGPSRTADIERVLTIGVQGPKALHIVVLDFEA